MNYSTTARLAGGMLVLFANTACLNANTASSEPTQIGEHLRFAGESVKLNTHVEGRHTLVSGIIDGHGPVDIIVDTGSGANVIDTAIAEKMGLEKVGEREVLSGGVEPMMLDVVVVPEIRIDGLSIVDAEFIMLDLDTFSMGLHQAIIGMKTFEDALLIFDPQNDAITVSSNSLSKDDPGVMAFEQTEQSIRRVKADVAGTDVWMHIDTGSPGGFVFPMEYSKTFPLQGELSDAPNARLVGGERTVKTGTLDDVIQLGDLTYVNPSVMFIDPSAPHGNIGGAVLGDLVMSIDQGNNLLSLRRSQTVQRTEGVASEGANKPRRLGIQLRGMGGGALTISKVIPGSLGEQAGFRSGDVLVTINDRPAQEYDMKKLGALFRSTTPLRFEVERDGEIRIIEID